MISIKEVISSKDIREFVDIQFSLYKSDAFWVPPLKQEEYKMLKRETNPAFAFCDAKFWIALKDGKHVGRIGAIINDTYNKKIGKRMGRFTRIEFVDEPEVFSKLMETAESWLRDSGMEAVHGPLGFTNLDNQGMLIEGFDYLPCIASVYHKPYYKNYFEQRGYLKENDWLEFRLTLNEHVVSKGIRGMELLKHRFGFEIVKADTKPELRKYSHRIFEILNTSFEVLPYVAPMDDAMIALYTKKYIEMLDPRFVTMVSKDGVVVGFFVGLANLSEAMQKAGGKLFPFGFIHLMKAMKKPKVIDMMLTGVLPEYHSSGVAVLLIAELQRRMMEIGINQLETTGVFETNHNVIANWKNYDHIQHKRRRCFVKNL
jgi:ribosomal protein S18 acetylase RimI-like enzyme